MPGYQQNSGRTLVIGRPNQIGEQLRNFGKEGAPPQYHRAVVLNVIFDTQLLTLEDKDQLKQLVSNPEFVDLMPSNSIIAKIVSQGIDTAPKPAIIYPFFQSHFLLPIQAGEHVYVVFDDFQQTGTKLGKWVTRIHEDSAVEDPNFTHADRRFNPTNNTDIENASTTAQRNEGNADRDTKPGFPNGGGTIDSYTLETSGSNNPYDEIYSNTLASTLHTYEPVPRFTKRPQEFVLQGMNNSLIVLGQDRTGPALRASGSTGQADERKDQEENAGIVDIVVGRGRYPLAATDGVNPIGVPPTGKPTSPFVVSNGRNLLEVDKVPKLRNRIKNIKEGDPDYKSDAARIFVGMNTKGDTNFGLLHKPGTNGQLEYAENTLRAKEEGKGEEPTPHDGVNGNSYFVGKADHVRIIARKVDNNPNGININGSILLLKEGTAVNRDASDGDMGYVYINKQGIVQIEGRRIFLGGAIVENDLLARPETAEPYIKYTKFKSTVDKLHDEIDELKNKLNSLIDALNRTAPSSLVGPTGGPDAAWSMLQTALPTHANPNKDATNQEVDAAKSVKIFGW